MSQKIYTKNSETFAEQLDGYLDKYENGKKISFEIPQELLEQKRARDEEEKKVFEQSRFRSSYRPPSLPSIDPILTLDLNEPLQLNDIDLKSLTGEGEYISEFDLARIDERLRSLGIDPSLIDKCDDDDEVSTLDLSNKIEQAIQIS